MKSDQKKDSARKLIEGSRAGNRRDLSKLLTAIENDFTSFVDFLAGPKLTKPPKHTRRIGITGPPGAGKSTLVNGLIGDWRKRGLSVAVLAVDPSSPFSGGALLGDRVRMMEHTSDEGVFIRSIASRGHGGGISAPTGALARALELSGFDIVLIETVGVGQTELGIMNLVDATAVVLVPESGDVIQTLKAGILEIADLFVVNKSDRPGADQLVKELEALVSEEASDLARHVLLTTATSGKGVSQLSKKLLELSAKIDPSKIDRRNRGELLSLLNWRDFQKNIKKVSSAKIKSPYMEFKKQKK